MPNKMKRRVGLRARMPHCPTVGRGERGEGRGEESCEPAAAAAPGLALGVSSLAGRLPNAAQTPASKSGCHTSMPHIKRCKSSLVT